MIDMSTFFENLFVHVFPHELNILQWSISNNYKKWEALIIASHGCCIEAKFGWISFACFQINQSTFYSNKRESIFPILMCHSLSFRFFVHLIHLRLFIFMSCKKSLQKILPSIVNEREKGNFEWRSGCVLCHNSFLLLSWMKFKTDILLKRKYNFQNTNLYYKWRYYLGDV